MNRPKVIQEVFDIIRFISFCLLPVTTIKAEFWRHTGYRLNLKNPITYNEKLQWLKLYWRDPNAIICADKYEVREYLEKKGLKHLLNELYFVFEDVNDINFQELPEKFILKTTHGCGQNIICRDKRELNWEKERKKLRKWLKRNQFFYSYEWMYKEIRPRIILERLIETSDGKAPVDYKVFCFHGEPKCLYVVTDRGENTTRFDFYDLDWNHIAVENNYPNNIKLMKRPKELEELLEYSRIISQGFPHMRVDFYIEEGRIIFGECTFFHSSGSGPFKPRDFDYQLGQYLNLPKSNEENTIDRMS